MFAFSGLIYTYVHRLEKYSRISIQPKSFFQMEDDWRLADGSSWAWVSACMVRLLIFSALIYTLTQYLGGIDSIHREFSSILTFRRSCWMWNVDRTRIPCIQRIGTIRKIIIQDVADGWTSTAIWWKSLVCNSSRIDLLSTVRLLNLL